MTTQAEFFGDIMGIIWGHDTPELDEKSRKYEDACETAQTIGAKPVGPQVNDQGIGDKGSEWLFPDGSTAHIITNDEQIGVGVHVP